MDTYQLPDVDLTEQPESPDPLQVLGAFWGAVESNNRKVGDRLLRETYRNLLQTAWQGWVPPSVYPSRVESYLEAESHMESWRKLPDDFSAFIKALHTAMGRTPRFYLNILGSRPRTHIVVRRLSHPSFMIRECTTR